MYPTIRFTRKYRLAFMITLIIAFFIISPLIILYTTGYRFDWNTKEIKQTGVLSVDGLPNDMNVYLNNIKIEKTLPIRLPNRAPGNYTLKLSRDGYQDWTKEISIESKKTTYIKNITLFKNISVSRILENFDEDIINISPSVTGNYLTILSAKEDVYSIDLYNTISGQTTSLARFNSIIQPEIFWSPISDFILLKHQSTDKRYAWQVFDVGNANHTHAFYSPNDIYKWQWSTKTYSPIVWLENSDKIIELSTTAENVLPISLKHIQTWFLTDNDELITYSTTTYGLVWNNKTTTLNDDVRLIVNANENRLIYKTTDETKVLQINNDNTFKVNIIPVYNTIFNTKTNEWLAYSNWELWTIYDDGDVELLHRTGEQMNFVLPLDEYGVLLLANKTKITAFNPGYYINHTLFSGEEIFSIGTDVTNRIIYFWGNAEGKNGIFKIEY